MVQHVVIGDKSAVTELFKKLGICPLSIEKISKPLPHVLKAFLSDEDWNLLNLSTDISANYLISFFQLEDGKEPVRLNKSIAFFHFI